VIVAPLLAARIRRRRAPDLDEEGTSMRSSVAVRSVLAALAALSAASALHAQSPQETVYFTAPSNRILKVTSFPSGTSATVVTDNGTNFKGLVVASEGSTAADTRIIAANTTKGGDIRAYSGTGTKLGVIGSLKTANAVTIDSGKNVWAVNADPGGTDRLVFIPRVGSGYGTPVPRTVPGVTLLADVKFVPSAKADATYEAGDVLVLSAKPAKILIFRGGNWQTLATNFNGTQPAGMTLAPDGEILVTTLQGRILAFEPDGHRQATDFASLSGKKGGQIAVGLQGGVPRVFATVTNGSALHRYSLDRNGSGELVGTREYSVASNVPFGVGNASLTGVAYTPSSDSAVSVLPVTGHEITFERVDTPGVTSGALYVVEEKAGVRQNTVNDGVNCPDGKLTIAGLSSCVPAHVRGFSRNGSDCLLDGTACFYLAFVTNTGAKAFGSTQEHHFEEHDHGFDTTCYDANDDPFNDPDSDFYDSDLQEGQPRTFYATDADDPKIVELHDFTDISTGCNSHIGRGGEFSIFLTGWDARSAIDVTSDKLAKLDLALNGTDPEAGGLATYIDPDLLGEDGEANTLANDLALAQQAWANDDATATIDRLEDFIQRVRGNLTMFNQCQPGPTNCRNAPGELIARAESAAFLACGASEDCQRTLP
jgi:hypothetical protein